MPSSVTLVLIYGPPAAGKLTVAQRLAGKTGFRLFHNHASIDFATTMFDHGTPAFNRTVVGLRRLVFTEAARSGVSFIFTYVYAHPQDIAEMRWMIGAVEDHGGQVKLVHLVCDPGVLRRRVSERSRRSFGKITSPAVLTELLDRYDLFSPYPKRESLRIDTTELPPEAAATRIAAGLGFKRAERSMA